MKEELYTVVGVWPDSAQKFMDSVYASSGDEAEAKINKMLPGLMVAGVVAGSHKAADTGPYVY